MSGVPPRPRRSRRAAIGAAIAWNADATSRAAPGASPEWTPAAANTSGSGGRGSPPRAAGREPCDEDAARVDPMLGDDLRDQRRKEPLAGAALLSES